MKTNHFFLTLIVGLIVISCGNGGLVGAAGGSQGGNTVKYKVSVSISPTETAGLVRLSGDSVVVAGTQLTLTAEPGSGYSFGSWTGDISSTANPLTITVNKNYSLTAFFKKN